MQKLFCKAVLKSIENKIKQQFNNDIFNNQNRFQSEGIDRKPKKQQFFSFK